VLYHQIGYRDFEGGESSGRAQAQTALIDAKNQGWSGETPILACFDRRMPAFTRGGVSYRAIWLDEVRAYMAGFRSVIGYEDSGFYGFEDTMGPCVAEDWVRFRMQCGARSQHISGISAWQENNEQPYLLGEQTDRLELYISLAALAGTAQEEDKPMIMLATGDRDPGPDKKVYWIAPTERGLVKEWVQTPVLAAWFTAHGAKTVALDQDILNGITMADPKGDVTAIVAGLTPAMISAINSLNLDGLNEEETVAAVQEALRRGTA
jgi:hypothetical protein